MQPVYLYEDECCCIEELGFNWVFLCNILCMNRLNNPFARYTILFLLLVVSYFIFAVFCAFLPDRAIHRHVKDAAVSLYVAGNYPKVLMDDEACQMDNFTDALILNQIYSIDRHQPVRSAMLMTRWQAEPVADLTSSLYWKTLGATGLQPEDYCHYWHGSSFLYRFLLMFFSINQLKLLLYITVLLLMFFFFRCYYPLAGLWNSLAFLLSWIMVYGFVMPASLQFFPMLAISLIACLLVVRFRKDSQALGMVFFVAASMSAYFDLLTVPLLSFGWPFAVWLTLPDKKTLIIQNGLRNILVWGLLWVAGYALTFLAKWLLGAVILGFGILPGAFEAGLYRVGAEDFTRWDAVVENVRLLPYGILWLVVLLFLVVGMIRSKGKFGVREILLLLTALIPYVWYLVLSNHSYQHFWFTYRLQAVTICAVFMAFLGSPRRA